MKQLMQAGYQCGMVRVLVDAKFTQVSNMLILHYYCSSQGTRGSLLSVSRNNWDFP